jgi:hypothetical protein
MNFSKAVAEFWSSFQKNSEALSQIATADDPVYDELLRKLQQIDAGLYFEFSVQPEQCELLITAEGDQNLFACVFDIVAAAPLVEGWKILALKPKNGFPKSVEWEGFKIAIADVVFEPLDNGEQKLGLRMFVPGLNQEDIDNAHNALIRAIDHGLGERDFAESIQYTEVIALDGPADGYIPLDDLDRYIQRHKKQRDC